MDELLQRIPYYEAENSFVSKLSWQTIAQGQIQVQWQVTERSTLNPKIHMTKT